MRCKCSSQLSCCSFTNAATALVMYPWNPSTLPLELGLYADICVFRHPSFLRNSWTAFDMKFVPLSDSTSAGVECEAICFFKQIITSSALPDGIGNASAQ